MAICLSKTERFDEAIEPLQTLEQLLPESTEWLERLVWAPVLSIGFQIIILMLMNAVGLAVSVPTIFVLAGATTFLSAIAAMLRYDELPL